jgi:hypothetical protein
MFCKPRFLNSGNMLIKPRFVYYNPVKAKIVFNIALNKADKYKIVFSIA